MTQTYDTSTINPSSTSPATDISKLVSSLDSLLSQNRGTSRPSYAAAGMIWVDSDYDTNIEALYFYDGSDDVLLGTFNTSTNIFTPDSTGLKAVVIGWTSQQYNAEVTLTDGVNISWNLNTGQAAKVTLGGNRTLDNPSNMKAGATYKLRIIQDGTGSRGLSFGSAYQFQGGAAPTLTTTAGAVDLMVCDCDGSNMNCVVSQDFS